MKMSPYCKLEHQKSRFRLISSRYKVGEAFLHMPQPRALKRLEKDQAVVDAKVAELAAQADDCETQMKQLKLVLYAKFGKAINLDE